MNKLLDYMIKQRNGHYMHALELHNEYELQNVIECIVSELQGQFTKEDFKDFFSTIELYHLDDDEVTEDENTIEEERLYNFNIDSFIDVLLD